MGLAFLTEPLNRFFFLRAGRFLLAGTTACAGYDNFNGKMPRKMRKPLFASKFIQFQTTRFTRIQFLLVILTK